MASRVLPHPAVVARVVFWSAEAVPAVSATAPETTTTAAAAIAVDPPSCVGTEGVAPDRLRDTANQVGTAVFAGEVTTVRRLG